MDYNLFHNPVNEFYRMKRMGVARQVRDNRIDTDE